MKIILIVLLGIVCCSQISGCNNKNDKDIRYRRSFNTGGLSKIEKDSIVNHVLDSLGVR